MQGARSAQWRRCARRAALFRLRAGGYSGGRARARHWREMCPRKRGMCARARAGVLPRISGWRGRNTPASESRSAVTLCPSIIRDVASRRSLAGTAYGDSRLGSRCPRSREAEQFVVGYVLLRDLRSRVLWERSRSERESVCFEAVAAQLPPSSVPPGLRPRGVFARAPLYVPTRRKRVISVLF